MAEQADHTEEEAPAGAESAAEQPDVVPVLRRRRRLMLVLGLVSLVALLPTLLSRFGLVLPIAEYFVPALKNRVVARTIELDWWSPVRIQGLQLTLKEANTAEAAEPARTDFRLQIAEVTSGEPLWRLAMNRGSHGSFLLREPACELDRNHGPAAIQKFVEELSGGDSSGTSAYGVQVQDGALLLADRLNAGRPARRTEESAPAEARAEGISFRAESIQARVEQLDGRSVPDIEISAEFPATQLTDGQRQAVRIAGTLDEITSDFPLIPLESASEESLAASPAGVPGSVKLTLTHPDESGGEAAPSKSTDAAVQELKLEAVGVDLEALGPLLRLAMPGWELRGVASGRLQGKIQSASTFALRGSMQVESGLMRSDTWAADEWLDTGTATLSLAGGLADDGILVSDLRMATDIFRWQCSGELRRGRTTVIADESSENGEGGSQPATESSRRISGNGQLNVAAVSGMLRQTLGLHEETVLEQGLVDLQLSALPLALPESETVIAGLRSFVSGMAWELTASLPELAGRRGNQPVRLQPDLNVRLSGVETTISRASLKGIFGTLETEPLEQGLRFRGRLLPDEAISRLQALVQWEPPQLGGPLDVSGTLRQREDSWWLHDFTANSPGVRMQAGDLLIRPTASPLQMFEGRAELAGRASAVMALCRPWFELNQVDPTAVMNVGLNAAADGSKLLDVQLAGGTRQAEGLFGEGRIAVELEPTDQLDLLTIRRGKATIPGLDLKASGTCASLPAGMLVDLEVTAEYDMERVSELAGLAAGGLRFQGRRADRFRVRGCPTLLVSGAASATDAAAEMPPLSVLGSAGWASGSYRGVPIGPCEIPFELREGIIRSDPFAFAFAGGRVTAMPQCDLVSRRIKLATGTRAENLQLSRELANGLLSYLAPFLAQTASVEGQVSARLRQAEIPFDAPSLADVSGTVSIAGIRSAPGPALQSLLSTVELIAPDQRRLRADSTLITMPAQEVNVSLSGGVVQHDQLTIEADGYYFRTGGVVRLADERLNLTLHVPLSKSRPGDPSVRTIPVPVGGTISQPQPDLTALGGRAGRQLLEDRLNDELNKGLNKLFDRF